MKISIPYFELAALGVTGMSVRMRLVMLAHWGSMLAAFGWVGMLGCFQVLPAAGFLNGAQAEESTGHAFGDSNPVSHAGGSLYCDLPPARDEQGIDAGVSCFGAGL